MYDQLIVVKVGTNVMKNKNNKIVRPVLQNIVAQIASLYERNIMTILVSSGSTIAGKEVLGSSKIKEKLDETEIQYEYLEKLRIDKRKLQAFKTTIKFEFS